MKEADAGKTPPSQGQSQAPGMRVLLHMVGLKSGGGKNDAKHILYWLPRVRTETDFLALVPCGQGYEELDVPANCEIIPVRSIGPSDLWRLVLDIVFVPLMCLFRRVDALFTVGNNGPIITPGSGHTVMIRRPQFVYEMPASVGWSWTERIQYAIAKGLTQLSVLFADSVITQTETMKRRVQEEFIGCRNVTVIGKKVADDSVTDQDLTQTCESKAEQALSTKLKGDQSFTFLYMTSYYPHKNIPTAADAVERARQEGYDVRLVTTLDDNGDEAKDRFLREVCGGRYADAVTNIGRVPMNCIRDVYEQCDAVVSTSLLESLSGIYLEGLAFGKPLIVSDRDFARCVCGNAAIYVDPYDIEDIVEKIIRLAENDNLRQQLIAAGRRRYKERYDRPWSEIAESYARILENTTSCSRSRSGGM